MAFEDEFDNRVEINSKPTKKQIFKKAAANARYEELLKKHMKLIMESIDVISKIPNNEPAVKLIVERLDYLYLFLYIDIEFIFLLNRNKAKIKPRQPNTPSIDAERLMPKKENIDEEKVTRREKSAIAIALLERLKMED